MKIASAARLIASCCASKVAYSGEFVRGARVRVTQAVFGAFHHFELARELERRRHLDRIYSTWPWARLKREGLPHSKVETFPWFHMAQLLALRFLPGWHSGQSGLGYANIV